MKLIDVTRRFGNVAKVARKELLKESKDKGIRKYRDYVLVIDRYLIPLLGKYQCHNITRDVLREFSEKRRQILGKVPSRSTYLALFIGCSGSHMVLAYGSPWYYMNP